MIQNREGRRVPQVRFQVREDNQWKTVTSDDVFKGKTIVVFGLPGAFTPTCSSSHVPRYNELAPVLQANGVDAVVCVSVNDSFVMNAWKEDQKADRIVFLPDGNGEFTQGMGMLVDKSDLGFGERSWRYSMLVKDGVIEKMFIEPQVEGDPFEVSDADTMLDYINPAAARPQSITVFTREGCPHCARAKRLLEQHGRDYEEIVTPRQATLTSLRAVAGADTVPQVFVDGRHIGGADELEAWFAGERAA